MDIWKFYGVTHRDHIVCNPSSEAKIGDLVERLPLKPGARLLDIACGKAAALLRIINRYQATGVGVDISPFEIEVANRNAKARNLDGRIEPVELDGAKYEAKPNSFDLPCASARVGYGVVILEPSKL
jgi:cyclopropane fatty-acyl-phospholipid synthase-like methyltransferase